MHHFVLFIFNRLKEQNEVHFYKSMKLKENLLKLVLKSKKTLVLLLIIIQ